MRESRSVLPCSWVSNSTSSSTCWCTLAAAPQRISPRLDTASARPLLERLAGGAHGGVHVRRRGRRHLGEHLAVRRVGDGQRRAPAPVRRAVDERAGLGCGLRAHEPVNAGARFSVKADSPSRESLERNSCSIRSRSSASPSSSDSWLPSCAARLIAAIASGGPAASLAMCCVEVALAPEEPGEHPELLRLLRLELAAGEQQVERRAEPDQARQPLRAAVAGQQPEGDLRRAHAVALVSAVAKVAGQRDLQAAAQRVALDPGHEELVRCGHARRASRAPRGSSPCWPRRRWPGRS